MSRPAIKLSCAVCMPLIALGSNAQTDTQNPVPQALEEIVVTAQKREQTLQDVPISISVATAQDIADINAFTFDDLEQPEQDKPGAVKQRPQDREASRA